MNKLFDQTEPTEAEVGRVALRGGLRGVATATAPEEEEVRRVAPRGGSRHAGVVGGLVTVLALAAAVVLALREEPVAVPLEVGAQEVPARYLDGLWTVDGDAPFHVLRLSPLRVAIDDGMAAFSAEAGPIEVEAGPVEVRSEGGAFRVRRDGEDVDVDVVIGAVEVRDPAGVHPVRAPGHHGWRKPAVVPDRVRVPEVVAVPAAVVPMPAVAESDATAFAALLERREAGEANLGPALDIWLASWPDSSLVSEAAWLRVLVRLEEQPAEAIAVLDGWLASYPRDGRVADAHIRRAAAARLAGRCDLARGSYEWLATHASGARARDARVGLETCR